MKIVDHCEDDLVIGAIAAVKDAQLSFQDLKQLFDVAMFVF